MLKLIPVYLLLTIAACSPSMPLAAPDYDGTYVGAHRANDLDICGIDSLEGTSTANITGGHLTLHLFGPGTDLDGSVNSDGTVRASGIWRSRHSNFPQVTILHGSISDSYLSGTASDFRCKSDILLHRVIIHPHEAVHSLPHSEPHPEPHSTPHNEPTIETKHSNKHHSHKQVHHHKKKHTKHHSVVK